MSHYSKAQVQEFYENYPAKIEKVRALFGRPLTLTEKILFTHQNSLIETPAERGEATLNFAPDRVAMQDATAQMAVLQFMTSSLDTVQVPTTIHCDHLIRAQSGSKSDLLRAVDENAEVYDFLKAAAAKYGIGFWEPGSGIIHQVVLEQYAMPGTMMIGTDSHTPNAGGLGMVAVGVGGADAVDVMAGQPWGLLNPKIIGVELTGELSGWSSPKDVILKVAELLTVKGGTGAIVEYFGSGTETISCTGKATITNMGAELGATTSVFGYDQKMSEYLRATEREQVADFADQLAADLRADQEVMQQPEKYYDQVVRINLSDLKPGWVGPHTPDLYRAVDQMAADVAANDYPDNIRVALIGSCTNSSYEDISRAAHIARQANAAGVKAKIPLMVTPGSDQVHQTIKRDGLMAELEQAGATVLANACGPCIGQWQREDISKGEHNTIVTSYNRNFRKRNDGNPETLAFIGSPEVVTAMAFSGSLSFNPLDDNIGDFKFSPPTGQELPEDGFAFSKFGYIASSEDPAERRKLTVEVDPKSERIALLSGFVAPQNNDYQDLVLLLKAQGKCTTDHISQAGPWLKYRGHLANIARNTYLGAVDAFTGESGEVAYNVLTGENSKTFPTVAFEYKQAGQGWLVVADENYGEGSSREHAAMQPRFLGCRAVIAKSFARIAETNLKKQGVLPLTFKNKSDFELIEREDRFDLLGADKIAEESELTLVVKKPDGRELEILLEHSLTNTQIGWYLAGSALNTIGKDLH